MNVLNMFRMNVSAVLPPQSVAMHKRPVDTMDFALYQSIVEFIICKMNFKYFRGSRQLCGTEQEAGGTIHSQSFGWCCSDTAPLTSKHIRAQHCMHSTAIGIIHMIYNRSSTHAAVLVSPMDGFLCWCRSILSIQSDINNSYVNN